MNRAKDAEGQRFEVTATGHYQQEYIRCGKARCKRCAGGGQGHGPYWYRYIWAGGKQRKKYVGKELPAEIQTELEIVPAIPKIVPAPKVLGTVPKTAPDLHKSPLTLKAKHPISSRACAIKYCQKIHRATVRWEGYDYGVCLAHAEQWKQAAE